MEIWEPKPPGTLWATPDLLRDSFFHKWIKINKKKQWLSVLVNVANKKKSGFIQVYFQSVLRYSK